MWRMPSTARLKDALIIPREELRLIIVDGKAANKAALVSVAKSLAQPYLKNLGSPTRIADGARVCQCRVQRSGERDPLGSAGRAYTAQAQRLVCPQRRSDRP